jgi:hypothetical protein
MNPIENKQPIITPSQLFLGLIFGENLCLPNKTPPKYAKTSHANTPTIITNNEVQPRTIPK